MGFYVVRWILALVWLSGPSFLYFWTLLAGLHRDGGGLLFWSRDRHTSIVYIHRQLGRVSAECGGVENITTSSLES